MKIKPKEAKVVTPVPFFKIAFGCSNMAFYTVTNELEQIADKIDIELYDGYITKKCDYEGDLDCIIVYNGERGKNLIQAICEFYEVNSKDINDDMDLHLSIY